MSENLKLIYHIGGEPVGISENDFEVLTDNFDKWLEEHNKSRIADGEVPESADEFLVMNVNVIRYEDS
jgi:hypothetical protein